METLVLICLTVCGGSDNNVVIVPNLLPEACKLAAADFSKERTNSNYGYKWFVRCIAQGERTDLKVER